MSVRPAMAVVLPSPHRTLDAPQLDHNPRSRSQPLPECRERQLGTRKRSANQVRARPAHPAVISSILDSFNALTPTALICAHQDQSNTWSQRGEPPRAYPTGGTVSSASREPQSAGFDIGYETSLSPQNGDNSDAALPPVIPTSRSASGRSNNVTSLPGRDRDLGNGQLQPPSIGSRTSSLYSLTKDKGSDGKNRHSAESWVKLPRSSGSRDTLDMSMPRKSLRRIASHASLRPTTIDEFVTTPTARDAPARSAPGDVFIKTPPNLASNKERVYLRAASYEGEIVTAPPVNRAEAGDNQPSSTLSTPSKRATPTPDRISPRSGPIADSIPLRTSSLRHSNSNPAPRKKRDNKSKRKPVSTIDPERPTVQRAQSIPESSWADLGEDDETVKRIRELRELRKSRLEGSTTYDMLAEMPTVKIEAIIVPTLEPTGARLESVEQTARTRPPVNRAITEPPVTGHEALGLAGDDPLPGLNDAVPTNSHQADSRSVERTRRPTALNQGKAYLQGPGSAALPTRPICLDYSYAQAVHVLQSYDQDAQRGKQPQRLPSVAARHSLTLKALDLPRVELPASPRALHPRPKTAKQIGDSDPRWPSHHPDLPIDFDTRRSRRKSMTDARRTRYEDEKLEFRRRDSIEVAATEYLHAPRLSRIVRHPRTGRIICFSEVGDAYGAPIFVCVGMGLTRYVTAFYDELATTLGLRLITVDRPGVGGSEPYPPSDRSGPLSWPDDILAICQDLGIGKFSLLAHSAGAIYALATALILPHLVIGKVHLLAPWVPPSQLEAVSHSTASAPPAGALPRSQRLLRVLPTSFLKAANSSFMSATSASIKPVNKRQNGTARVHSRDQSLSPTRASEQRPLTGVRSNHHHRDSMMQMDQFMPMTGDFPIPIKEEDESYTSLVLTATSTPTDPSFAFAATALNAAEHAEKERKVDYMSRLTQRTWELATRDSNPATDLLVCLERHREIGFRYTDVCRDVVITHGSIDKRVPVGNVRWLSEQMNARADNGPTIRHGSLTSGDGWTEDVFSRGRCEVRVLEGQDHGLMASAPIMGDILTEIAGYWTPERTM